MKFSLTHKPAGIPCFRKSSTVQLLFVAEPFVVETQEWVITISPDTVDDWDEVN